MNKTSRKNYDVYLSYSHLDAALADVVSREFVDAGLTVFKPRDLPEGENWAEEVREQLVVSAAFVVLLTPSALNSSWLAVERGAAWSWEKPAFVLLHETRAGDVPPFLSGCPIYPMNRLGRLAEEVARVVSTEHARMSQEQREKLGRLYEELGVPTDQLATQPAVLSRLVRQFNKAFQTDFSQDRVLQELIRVRKAGHLPRLGRSKRNRKLA